MSNFSSHDVASHCSEMSNSYEYQDKHSASNIQQLSNLEENRSH
jgi:hypothetical protein